MGRPHQTGGERIVNLRSAFRVPIVFLRVAIVAGHNLYLVAHELARLHRMRLYVRYPSLSAANHALDFVVGLASGAFQIGHSFFQLFHSFGQFAKLLPDGCLVEDFQNV